MSDLTKTNPVDIAYEVLAEMDAGRPEADRIVPLAREVLRMHAEQAGGREYVDLVVRGVAEEAMSDAGPERTDLIVDFIASRVADRLCVPVPAAPAISARDRLLASWEELHDAPPAGVSDERFAAWSGATKDMLSAAGMEWSNEHDKYVFRECVPALSAEDVATLGSIRAELFEYGIGVEDDHGNSELRSRCLTLLDRLIAGAKP